MLRASVASFLSFHASTSLAHASTHNTQSSNHVPLRHPRLHQEGGRGEEEVRPTPLPPSLAILLSIPSLGFHPLVHTSIFQTLRDSDEEAPPARPGGEDYYVGGNGCVWCGFLPPSLLSSSLPHPRFLCFPVPSFV